MALVMSSHEEEDLIPIVDMLLKRGADRSLTRGGSHGYTAYEKAVELKKFKLADLLLVQKRNVVVRAIWSYRRWCVCVASMVFCAGINPRLLIDKFH